MKKIAIAIFVIIIMAIPVSAQDMDIVYSRQIDNIISEYSIDFEKLKEYPFETIWDMVKTNIKNYLVVPVGALYKITSILMIATLINFLNFDNNKQIAQIINTVAMLIMFYTVYENITEYEQIKE